MVNVGSAVTMNPISIRGLKHVVSVIENEPFYTLLNVSLVHVIRIIEIYLSIGFTTNEPHPVRAMNEEWYHDFGFARFVWSIDFSRVVPRLRCGKVSLHVIPSILLQMRPKSCGHVSCMSTRSQEFEVESDDGIICFTPA